MADKKELKPYYEIFYPLGNEIEITPESQGSAIKVKSLTRKQFERASKKLQKELKKRKKKK